MGQSILLDPSIRDWVLLPLIGILFSVNILRHYATLLLSSPSTPNMSKIVNVNIANYGRLLVNSGGELPPESFKQRAEGMIETELKKEVDPPNPLDMMNDTSMMSNMLKSQFMTMVPSIGMMMLISYFFSGFVVAQFPFPLSPRFRGMVQRGLDIDDLDGNYVTSLSLYFIIMAGSQGLMSFLLGQNVDDMSEQALMVQMSSGAQSATPENYQQVFKQITTELEFMKDHHKWDYAGAPELLLKEWRANKKKREAGAQRR